MKEKSIKFRCSQEEYDLLNEEREKCGVNMTSFIRGKVFREGNRIIRNPEMVTVVRDVNQEIIRVCIALHNDRDHMHAHITFDSISKNDGRKFHSPKGDWEKRIQPITDRICKKYGIPALDYEKDRPKGMDYGSWKDGKEHVRKQKEGKFSWYDVIRDDIDEAIEASGTYEEFLEHLKKQHYEVRDKKYLSLRPYGKDRSVRLGEEYTRERIIARIEGPKKGVEFKRYGDQKKASETVREYKRINGSLTKYKSRMCL